MRIRRVLHEKIQKEIKRLPDNENSILTGWVLLTEIAAPGNEVGMARDVYGFCSDATGVGDAAPWEVMGWMRYAFYEYDEMFLTEPDENGE